MERKTKEIITITILAIIILAATFFVFEISRKQSLKSENINRDQQQTTAQQENDLMRIGQDGQNLNDAQKQAQELDEQQKANQQPATLQEIQKQGQELYDQSSNQQPATQQEINDQLRQLNVSL